MKMDEKDRKYRKLLKKLGYPTSPKGLDYSKQELIYDLEQIGDFAKNGPRSMGGAILYKDLRDKYPDVHYAAVLAYLGEERLIDMLIENSRFDIELCYEELEDGYEELKYMKEWYRKGGIIRSEDFRKLFEKAEKFKKCYEQRMAKINDGEIMRIAMLLGVEEKYRKKLNESLESDEKFVNEKIEKYRKKVIETMQKMGLKLEVKE